MLGPALNHTFQGIGPPATSEVLLGGGGGSGGSGRPIVALAAAAGAVLVAPQEPACYVLSCRTEVGPSIRSEVGPSLPLLCFRDVFSRVLVVRSHPLEGFQPSALISLLLRYRFACHQSTAFVTFTCYPLLSIPVPPATHTHTGLQSAGPSPAPSHASGCCLRRPNRTHCRRSHSRNSTGAATPDASTATEAAIAAAR